VGGRNTNTTRRQTIKPEEGQVTMIVVHRSKPAGSDEGAGKRGKKAKE
jgi:hypothetical protein